MLNDLLDPLISLIYPQNCAVCGGAVERRADGPACASCWSATTIFSAAENFCQKCGEPTTVRADPSANCGHCPEHEFDIARAAGVYEKALKATVLSLKTETHLPSTAERCLIEAFERLSLPSGTLIIPVPISKARRIERGFNQAEILAAALSKNSGLEADEHSLVRITHTRMHRAAMDRKAREATVKNAFEVVRPKLIFGRNVLLVDDLYTSGATASNCARTLKKSGAGRVTVLTLARAVFDR